MLAARLVRCVSQVASRRATTCALLGLVCVSCNSTSSPESYVDLTMEPREFNIAVGVSGPLTVTYLVTTSSGRGAAVPASEVSLSVRDTFYAVVRKDTIFTRRVRRIYVRSTGRLTGDVCATACRSSFSSCGDSTGLNEPVRPPCTTLLVMTSAPLPSGTGLIPSAGSSGRWRLAVRRAVACALVSAAASCDTTSSPDAYTQLTIEPRELTIAAGQSRSVRLVYFLRRLAGTVTPSHRAP